MFLNAPWKLFYVNLPFEWLFVTFWKLLRSHAITLRWLDDAKEFNQSGCSKQRDSCSLAKSWPRMLVASKAVVFLENYLAVSTWILDGSSIECHEKKRQRFILSGVRFWSRMFDLEAIQIYGTVKNELFILDSFLQRVATVNAKPANSLKFAILSRKRFETSK